MRVLNNISIKLKRISSSHATFYSIASVFNKSPHNSANKQQNCCHDVQPSQTFDSQFKTLPSHQQTICALASGSGACGVAVLRISGPNALTLGLRMMNKDRLQPRYATYAKIYHPTQKVLIDTGLALWFPGPNSFTGEDVLELQVHGSPSVVKSLLAGMVETNLARIAKAGEFTRRAFYNQKMDLAEVEGLRDLLNADTEVQRKQALAMSRGVQSKKINEWLSHLNDCASLIDGHIEFGDTDHVSVDIPHINSTLSRVHSELQQAIRTSAKGFTIKHGINIALYGETNVGKSSLLNALTSEDRAIVSDMPNTTRDLIQVRMDLNGYAAILTDTAGFYNDPNNRVETEALNKSVQVLFDQNTALHVLVMSAEIYLKYLTQGQRPSIEVMKQYIADMFISGLVNDKARSIQELFLKPTIVVITKVDLIVPDDLVHFGNLFNQKNVLGTSVFNNDGLDKLLDALNGRISELYADFSPEDVHFSNVRTFEAVKMASQSVTDAILIDPSVIDMKAHFVRAAIGHLAGILGKSCSKDMLDDIFEKFCVGK